MADTKNTSLRKRQQIQSASKAMFLWVAGAAAIVGVAIVLSVSLFERLSFNQVVLNEKNKTVRTLEKNNELVSTLKDNVRVLNTNQSLVDTPRIDGTEPLSVVLDALPSNPNSSALGASLQQKLLDQDGVTIEALTVLPITGVEDSKKTSGSRTKNSTKNEIRFEFVISAGTGRADDLKSALLKLERSIRAVDITSMTVEQQSTRIVLSAEGRAFYQPERQVELTEKRKKP